MIVPRYTREIPHRYRLEAGRCTGCGYLAFPRRQICPECRGREFEGVNLKPEGTVLSFTVCHVAADCFATETPFAVAVIETMVLAYTHYREPGEAFRQTLFHVISCMTSTGFTTTDFSVWPVFLPTLLVFVGFVGGCGGSTAGGIKVLRVVLLFRNSLLQVRRLFHPRLVASVKLGERMVPQRIMDGVWGFFALYVAVFVVLMLAVMSTGVDQVTAFSAVATCINNMGPGLGEVSANFVPLSAGVKWLLVLAMWLGRLEMFTILVLLAPALWRV